MPFSFHWLQKEPKVIKSELWTVKWRYLRKDEIKVL